MSDDTASQLKRMAARNNLLNPLPVFRLPRLGRSGVTFGCLGAAVIIALYMNLYEGGPANQLFVATATLLLAAMIVLATRRMLVAAVAVPILIGIVVHSGTIKHQLMAMNLHAYDVVFYLTSGPTVSFMWDAYRGLMVQLISALLAFAFAVVAAYRMDTTRIARFHALAGVAVMAALTSGAADLKGERAHTQQYWGDLTLSTFYSSVSDTAEALWRGQIIEAGPPAGGPLLSIPSTCTPLSEPPNIILIHQESVVPPSIVPAVVYDKTLDAFFRSFDNRMHPLRVETYGGASWLTEFSILTGVSTFAFGGMRAFVHSLMSGKIRDTVPQNLARCGYRNVVFFPGDRHFVSYAKFYEATGMSEIIDSHDMKAKRLNERDRFFYDHALTTMKSHFTSSDKPLFSYILTMATHGPYDHTYMPAVKVPGGGQGMDSEMSEYLRRLAMARMDHDYFIGELTRRFPNEKFLIVHYGDHHPAATRTYLGYAGIVAPHNVVLPRNSVGYLTYFAVDGIRYTPPPLPLVDTLDVPYLGTIILDAARLPLSPANQERKRLMALCEGRYDGCDDRMQILAFHRRLIDSGIIDAH